MKIYCSTEDFQEKLKEGNYVLKMIDNKHDALAYTDSDGNELWYVVVDENAKPNEYIGRITVKTQEEYNNLVNV